MPRYEIVPQGPEEKKRGEKRVRMTEVTEEEDELPTPSRFVVSPTPARAMVSPTPARAMVSAKPVVLVRDV